MASDAGWSRRGRRLVGAAVEIEPEPNRMLAEQWGRSPLPDALHSTTGRGLAPDTRSGEGAALSRTAMAARHLIPDEVGVMFGMGSKGPEGYAQLTNFFLVLDSRKQLR